jgi:LmbE family N-acetylglucosaminyl deacetylase
MKNKKILVVAAHPDDAEFTSGGSLARWISEGWNVSLIICTDGGKGSQSSENDSANLAKTRQAEQEASARVLGLREVIWLGHPDGQLARLATRLEEQLTQLIRKYRPDRLLAWDAWKPYQLHPDHRTAGQAAMDAILAAGNPHFYIEQFQQTPGLQPHQVREVYLYGTDEPDEWVNITSTFDRKMEAIACHQSQIASLRDLSLQMSRCNRDRGVDHGYAYAEAYKVLHPFCDT